MLEYLNKWCCWKARKYAYSLRVANTDLSLSKVQKTGWVLKLLKPSQWKCKYFFVRTCVLSRKATIFSGWKWKLSTSYQE